MSESRISQNHTSDEIDLYVLFKKIIEKISSALSFLVKILLTIFVFLIRKAIYLFIFTLAGVLIGLWLFSSTERYYSSSLEAQPNGIANGDMINYINDLHELCVGRNISSLSNALGIEDTLAQKIKDIRAYWIIDINKDGTGDYVDSKNEFKLKDTTQRRLNDRFNLSVEVFDLVSLPNVRDGISNYIKKSPYLQKLNEIRKKDLKELIDQTEEEITKLDSLQKVEYFQKTKKPIRESQVMFLAENPPQLYYRDILSLYSQKQRYEKELDLSIEPITIIKDFTKITKAENPKSLYAIKYGVVFFILGFLVIVLVSNWKFMKDYVLHPKS